MTSVDPANDERRATSASVAGQLSLLDIRLTNADVKLISTSHSSPLETKWELAARVEVVSEVVAYHVSYALKASGSGRKKSPVFDISFALMLTFRRTSDKPLAIEDLQVFGAYGVVEIAHPYLREMSHNLTARMGVPPLIVEVLDPTRGSHIDPRQIGFTNNSKR
ncbi:hypothetical protein Lfu02_80330 [Longispora fulva]|uniref:Uncharacterized protein n=1 Tax=Longispora fulva TaxID=619741 RepID=A0A8J7KXV3_9ACTN|nr:hypothetical protein [Longispora fulva]MBG6138377.1 hypothetical protein [Longispora fulva]GIG63661.1 hypothetical protein Lfu02_80330 [Longispora fulva]